MPLPEHLQPVTYWEKRCELLEEAVERLVQTIAQHLPYAAHEPVSSFLREWGRLLGELGNEHPAPKENTDANT